MRGSSHLLDVKQDYKLGNIDEGQQRAKQGPHPNHSLSVNQPQHIGGNHKLLPPKGLNQLVGHVVHQNSQVKKTTTTTQSCSAFTSNAMLPVMAQSPVPAGEFHQDQHGHVDEEVKQRQLVHLLANACFPALCDTARMTGKIFLWSGGPMPASQYFHPNTHFFTLKVFVCLVGFFFKNTCTHIFSQRCLCNLGRAS